MKSKVFIIFFLILAGLAGCKSGPECKTPENIDMLREDIRQYYHSGCYDAEIAQVVDQAKKYLKEHASSNSRKPVVVLAIDETALSNWIILNRKDFTMSQRDWTSWNEKEKAVAIKPTLELVNQARKQGCKVYFVTNRRESLRKITESNLRKAGFSWDGLLMKPEDDFSKLAQTYKIKKRHELENRGYRIILNIGSQQSDLGGNHSGKTFKLPNPFYFVH